MGNVRRGHNKIKSKLTRDNNGKFGRVVKRSGGSKVVPDKVKAVGVLVKRVKDKHKKKIKQPVKVVKPSKVVHKHHNTTGLAADTTSVADDSGKAHAPPSISTDSASIDEKELITVI